MTSTPKKIGKYNVISQLAVGGMGEIYKAEHPTLGSTVIIKCLTIQNNPAIEERFRREARIMMELRDERIVQVYDHFKERSSYCIVMEYVDGIDLDDLIKSKRYLTNDMALMIFSEVCKALKYAHERKVIHRDIKPANILISNAGEVKLTDFGVAATMEQDEDLTSAGMTLGTPAYMSPEQISDPSKVDQRADIYSIGVLLYVMLTGQKPFESSFEPQVLSKVTRGRYILPRKINPRISPPVQRLLKKAMHHKIKKRFQNIEEVLKKCSKLLKSYQDKKQVNGEIKRYLEGKESVHDKVPKRNWFGFKHVIIIITLLVLCIGGIIGYRTGIQYEFLNSDKFGALKVEAKIRKSKKAFSKPYPQCTLFVQNTKGWEKVGSVDFSFKEDISASDKTYSILHSQKKYLPEGNYLIRLDIENEQYQTQFYLNSRSIQKNLPSEKDGYQISMAMEKTSPRLPLKLNCIIRDQISKKDVTDDAVISIFYKNEWIPWQEFVKDESLLKSFTSGKDYSFRITCDGFFPKYANISVDPEQTLVNLGVTLTPVPGDLLISAKIPDLIVLLNNSPYYLDGNKSPAYKRLPQLNTTAQKISLPAGDYFLTIKEETPWWRRISFLPPKLYPLRSITKKITIHQGETLNVLGNVNIADGELKLEIQ